MSVVLKKADGDLFIDRETGRSALVSGPSKVDQEMASLYLTEFDADRQWGSNLDIKTFGPVGNKANFKSILYLRVQQANARLIAKQGRDLTLDPDNEKIQQFSNVQVKITEDGGGMFLVVADVGTSAVAQTIGVGYQPTSIDHVLSPPFGLLAGA
jgi:hypothetical protein